MDKNETIGNLKIKQEVEKAKTAELKRKKLEGELYDDAQVKEAISRTLVKTKSLCCKDCQKM